LYIFFSNIIKQLYFPSFTHRPHLNDYFIQKSNTILYLLIGTIIIIKYLHSSEVHVVGAVNELKGSEDYVDYKYQVSD